ncbi:MAG: acyltransferase [Acidithiobacillus sp.]
MPKKILAIVICFCPQTVKRFLWRRIFGFDIHPSARIGFSLVTPDSLVMRQNAKIGHFNVIKGVSEIILDCSASIGNLNWVSGFEKNTSSGHFTDQYDRSPRLLVGEHSSITSRHLIDCTDTVSIGKFATIAGFRSQILTHSISIAESRQRSGTVMIGDYTFVGTGSIILPGSFLPSFSVLGAGSMLNKNYTEEYKLYGGVPARPLKSINGDSAYFTRKIGYVI